MVMDQEAGLGMLMIRRQKMIKNFVIIITAGLILFLSEIGYHFIHHSEKINWIFWLSYDYISIYGAWISYILLFFGLGRLVKNRWLKWLFFYELSIFWTLRLFLSSFNKVLEYIDIKIGANGFIDDLLKTKFLVLCLILSTILCLLLCLFRGKHSRYGLV